VTADATFLHAPEPLVPAGVVTDLIEETTYLSRALGQPFVRTPGASGVLNRVAPSTVWVHSKVEVAALAAEVVGCDPSPEVMLPEHAGDLLSELTRRGWQSDEVVDRLRRDLTMPVDRSVTPAGFPWVTIRSARRWDLKGLRQLYIQAFETEDSADYVPDTLLEVPGLTLFVAEDSSDRQRFIGTCGVRLRHEGTLIFGLAVVPEHRRCGIATALVSRCLAWAADMGAPYALADVDDPAPLMWKRLGFVSTSRWRRCVR